MPLSKATGNCYYLELITSASYHLAEASHQWIVVITQVLKSYLAPEAKRVPILLPVHNLCDMCKMKTHHSRDWARYKCSETLPAVGAHADLDLGTRIL